MRRIAYGFLAANLWHLSVAAARYLSARRSHARYRDAPLLDGLKDWPPR